MAAKNIRQSKQLIAVAISSSSTQADEASGNLTVSIGIAAYKKTITVEEFIKRADQALYQAKKQGKTQVVVYQ